MKFLALRSNECKAKKQNQMGAFYFMACGMKCFPSFKCRPQQQLEWHVPAGLRVRYHHPFIIVSFFGPIPSNTVRVGIPLTIWVRWKHVFCSVWWHPGGNLYLATPVSCRHLTAASTNWKSHDMHLCPAQDGLFHFREMKMNELKETGVQLKCGDTW